VPNHPAPVDDLRWFVAHTRPRCEKKLARYYERAEFPTTLPCCRTVHRYRGKTVTFDKPLFPAYVFLQLRAEDRGKASRHDHLVRLLEVTDQALFTQQLGDIMRALETECEVFIAPGIKAGSHVRIRHGPLRGMEGWVEQRSGTVIVLLRLDFIGQAAAVKMDASDLELI
jgi:transcription antitermination factor NusG